MSRGFVVGPLPMVSNDGARQDLLSILRDSIAVAEELGEVPLDGGTKNAGLLVLKVLPERVGVIAIDLDLPKEGEGCFL